MIERLRRSLKCECVCLNTFETRRKPDLVKRRAGFDPQTQNVFAQLVVDLQCTAAGA